eukprot:9478773-Pyramimonas_sp.AAC.1
MEFEATMGAPAEQGAAPAAQGAAAAAAAGDDTTQQWFDDWDPWAAAPGATARRAEPEAPSGGGASEARGAGGDGSWGSSWRGGAPWGDDVPWWTPQRWESSESRSGGWGWMSGQGTRPEPDARDARYTSGGLGGGGQRAYEGWSWQGRPWSEEWGQRGCQPGPTSPGTSTGWYWQDCPWSEEWGQSSWQPGSGGYCGSVRYEGSGPSGQERGDDKFVPEWDGKAVPLRTYERRVKIFELNTAILPERRGGRLLSRLKGDAEAKTENLDPETLARPDGVRVLLRYLHEKYDQQETLKVGTLVDEFVEKVSRNAGEEIMDFETRYEAKVRELEEAMEEPLNKHLKAHYFLKKLRVGGDKESQIITGAGNELVYEKLRDSAKACIPRVSMLRNRAAAPFNGANREYLNRNRRRLGKPLGRGGARKVHATENAEAEAEREGAEAEGPSTSAEEDDDDEEPDSEVDAGVDPNIAENELVPEELQAYLTENE